MNVLVLQPDSELYGACRSLLRTLTAMGEERPTVTSVFPYEGPALQAYRDAGIGVHIEPELAVLRRSTKGLRGLVRLGRANRRAGRRLAAAFPATDLVHANSMSVLAGIGVARELAVPLVWQLREAPSERGLRARVLSTLLKRYASRVACISSAAASLVPASVPTSMTPNGYERSPQFPPVETRAGAQYRIGVVARLIPTKGQLVVLDAVAQLPDVLRDRVELVLAGTPYPGHEPYVEQVRERALQLGLQSRVTLPGWVDPMEPLLDTLDVLVVPTTTGEGFSTIALEALAAGVPVVAAADGGILELVDETCGRIVAPGSASEIAAALQQILSHRNSFTHAAQARAASWSLYASAAALWECWNQASPGATG